jgi:hypothetical protein
MQPETVSIPEYDDVGTIILDYFDSGSDGQSNYPSVRAHGNLLQ